MKEANDFATRLDKNAKARVRCFVGIQKRLPRNTKTVDTVCSDWVDFVNACRYWFNDLQFSMIRKSCIVICKTMLTED